MKPADKKRLERLEATIQRSDHAKPAIVIRIIDAADGQPAPGPREMLHWDYEAGQWREGALQ